MIHREEDQDRGSGRDRDFAPLPSYTQTRNSNESYTTIVTARTDSDGTVTQSLQIISKR